MIVGSTVFYGWWRPAYVELPYILTVTAWAGTLWLSTAKEERVRRLRFAATIVLVFLPLVIVKYAYFVANDVLGLKGVVDTDQLRWPLPLGISFITFTLSAYVIDVYRGQYQAERSLPLVLSYVLFFPHLIAGPILRPHESDAAIAAHARCAWRAFSARRCHLHIGPRQETRFRRFRSPLPSTGSMPATAVTAAGSICWRLTASRRRSTVISAAIPTWLLGLPTCCAFACRPTFCDPTRRHQSSTFGANGTSRCRIGCAIICTSRWAAIDGGRAPQFRNIVITMMLGGLWHGANWTFLIWGLLHGLALGATHLLRSPMRSFGIVLPGWIAVLLPHFTSLPSRGFSSAPANAKTVQNFIGGLVHGSWRDPIFTLQQNAFVILLLVVFFALHRFDRHALLRICVRRANRLITIAAIAFFWMLTIAISQGSSGQIRIHFDF